MVNKTSLSEKLQKNPLTYLLLFTVIYAIAEFCSTFHRPFWIDEIYTYELAELPSIQQIWPLIKQGIELNPPLPFWTTWLIHHSVGKGEFFTRLPAVVGFWMMCICLFHFVRRRSDTLHAFIALLLPVFTFTHSFATSARGYGLLLGFSAGALLSWQYAKENRRRAVSLLCLTLCLAGALSCHYYALYVCGALALGEFVRTVDSKRVDVLLWIALIAGSMSLVAYRSLLTTAGPAVHTFWIRAEPRFLYESYSDLFGSVTLVLLLLFSYVLRIHEGDRVSDWTPATLPRDEVAACVTLAAMPLALYVGSLFLPIPFYSRYVLPVVIGVTILSVLFLYRIGGNNAQFRRLVISLVVWVCLLPWTVWHITLFFIQNPQRAVIAATKINFDLEPSLPILVDNQSDFLSLYFYAPKSMRTRLFTLQDSDSAIKYLGSDTTDRSLRLLQGFRDFHVTSYQEFMSAHHDFLIARTKPEGWILQKLNADGAQIELISDQRDLGYFVPDSLLFRVKVR